MARGMSEARWLQSVEQQMVGNSDDGTSIAKLKAGDLAKFELRTEHIKRLLTGLNVLADVFLNDYITGLLKSGLKLQGALNQAPAPDTSSYDDVS
jgi:hypothetical protein